MANSDDDFNPFTDEDRERIFQSVSDDSEGWEFVSRSEHAEVWKRPSQDSDIHLIKGYLKFPGIPPEAVLDMITNLEVRKKWDTQFPVIEVLEEHKHYKVVYWRIKMPPAVADRDLVQYIGYRKDEATNSWYIMYKNGEHASRPPQPGVVRAETILSGSIIRADDKDPSSAHMSVLLQNDAKGWIPKFVVNMFQARAPGSWRDTLYNYFVSDYRVEYEKKFPEEDKTTGTD